MDELINYNGYEEFKQAVNRVLNRTVEDFVLTGYLLKQEFSCNNSIRNPFQNQFRQNTDSKPTLNHRHDRVVIPCCEMYFRL